MIHVASIISNIKKNHEQKGLKLLEAYDAPKTIDSLKGMVKQLLFSPYDTAEEQEIKRKALLKAREIFSGKSDISSIDFCIDRIGELAMIHLAKSYRSISANDYDVFIFDADKTIWDGPPAFKFEAPYQKIDENTVQDSQGLKLTLKGNVRETLSALREMGKDVGLLSKSEKQGVPYQDQPVILLLKEFGILESFNEMISVNGDFPKSMFIPKNKRVIFIDDDKDNLIDVKENTNADVADADDIEFMPSNLAESIYMTKTAKVMLPLVIDEDFEPIHVVEMSEYDEAEIDSEVEPDDLWYVNLEDFKNGIKQEACLESKSKDDYPKVIMAGVQNPKAILVRLTTSGVKKLGPMEIVAERKYIPQSERPKKPKGDYQLDHKKPLWQGGENKKDNLEWIPKDTHKKKTQEEGSFEHGGDLHQKQEKSKGKKHYHDYQSGAAKEKVKQERSKLGEEGFSQLQRERAKKRWAEEVFNLQKLGLKKNVNFLTLAKLIVADAIGLNTSTEQTRDNIERGVEQSIQYRPDLAELPEEELQQKLQQEIFSRKINKYKKLILNEFGINLQNFNDPDTDIQFFVDYYDQIIDFKSKQAEQLGLQPKDVLNLTIDQIKVGIGTLNAPAQISRNLSNELNAFFQSRLNMLPGEYRVWAVKNAAAVINPMLSLKDQEQPLYEIVSLLINFNKLKAVHQKNIQEVGSVEELKQIVSQHVAPDLNDDELQKEYAKLGPPQAIATKMIDGVLYELFQSRGLSDQKILGEGTVWCFRCENGVDETAQHYAANGALFIIRKNGQPFLAVDKLSRQLMDVNDNQFGKSTFDRMFPEFENIIKGKTKEKVDVMLNDPENPDILDSFGENLAFMMQDGIIDNDNEHLATETLIHDPTAYKFFSERLRSDKGMFAYSFKKSWDALNYIAGDLKNDQEFLQKQVSQKVDFERREYLRANPKMEEGILTRGWDDPRVKRAFAMFLVRKPVGIEDGIGDAGAINFFNYYGMGDILDDGKTMGQLAKKNPGILKYIKEDFYQKPDDFVIPIVLRGMATDGRILSFLPDKLKNNKKVVATAVENGGSLEYASDQMKSDREIITLAVKTRGSSELTYVPREIREDDIFIMDLIHDKKDGRILNYASATLKNDQVYILKLAHDDEISTESVIRSISTQLANDIDFAKEVFDINPFMYQYFGNTVKKSEDAAQYAMNLNPNVISTMEETFGENKEFIMRNIRRSPGIYRFIKDSMRADADISLLAFEWTNANPAMAIDNFKYLPMALERDHDFLLKIMDFTPSLIYNKKEVSSDFLYKFFTKDIDRLKFLPNLGLLYGEHEDMLINLIKHFGKGSYKYITDFLKNAANEEQTDNFVKQLETIDPDAAYFMDINGRLDVIGFGGKPVANSWYSQIKTGSLMDYIKDLKTRPNLLMAIQKLHQCDDDFKLFAQTETEYKQYLSSQQTLNNIDEAHRIAVFQVLTEVAKDTYVCGAMQGFLKEFMPMDIPKLVPAPVAA